MRLSRCAEYFFDILLSTENDEIQNNLCSESIFEEYFFCNRPKSAELGPNNNQTLKLIFGVGVLSIIPSFVKMLMPV